MKRVKERVNATSSEEVDIAFQCSEKSTAHLRDWSVAVGSIAVRVMAVS